MRNIIGLLILGTFLTGCYSSSLTMVGPATGVASGKVGESAITSSFNYVVKKQTGKSAIVVRNHRFSEVHVRSFANFIMPKIIQVKFIYQIYVNIMQKIYSMKAKSHRERDDDDYFTQ